MLTVMDNCCTCLQTFILFYLFS